MSGVLSKFTCNYIPEGDSCGLVVTLIEQNAKLRELASELLRELVKADRSRSHGWLFEAARELRIEVDG